MICCQGHVHDTSIAAANGVLLHKIWFTQRVSMTGTVLMGRGASLTAQIASPAATAPGGTDLRPGAATAPMAPTTPLKGADRPAGMSDLGERHPRAVTETVMGPCGGLRPRELAGSAAPRPTARTSDGQGQMPVAALPAAPRPAGMMTGPVPASARAALRSAHGRASGVWVPRRTAHRTAARSRQGIERPRRARRTGRRGTGGGARRSPPSAAQSEQTCCLAAQAPRSRRRTGASAAGTRAQETGRARMAHTPAMTGEPAEGGTGAPAAQMGRRTAAQQSAAAAALESERAERAGAAQAAAMAGLVATVGSAAQRCAAARGTAAGAAPWRLSGSEWATAAGLEAGTGARSASGAGLVHLPGSARGVWGETLVQAGVPRRGSPWAALHAAAMPCTSAELGNCRCRRRRRRRRLMTRRWTS